MVAQYHLFHVCIFELRVRGTMRCRLVLADTALLFLFSCKLRAAWSVPLVTPPSLPPSSRPPCEISPGSLQPILLNTIIFRQSTRNILKYYILILTTGTLGYNNVNYVFKYLCCYKHGPVTRSCFIVLTSEFEYFPIEKSKWSAPLEQWSPSTAPV